MPFAVSLLAVLAVAAQDSNPRGPAADTLLGVVLDQDGAALEGARVVLPELGREARTDRDGKFRISRLAPGRYMVIISHPGYAPSAEAVAVPLADSLRVRLVPSPFDVEPRLVSGPDPPPGGTPDPAAIPPPAG